MTIVIRFIVAQASRFARVLSCGSYQHGRAVHRRTRAAFGPRVCDSRGDIEKGYQVKRVCSLLITPQNAQKNTITDTRRSELIQKDLDPSPITHLQLGGGAAVESRDTLGHHYTLRQRVVLPQHGACV